MQKFEIEGLFDFLNKGVSAFHSTAAAVEILEANGYENRPETAAWELVPGGKYYTTRNGSDRLACHGQPQRLPHVEDQGAGRRQGCRLCPR